MGVATIANRNTLFVKFIGRTTRFYISILRPVFRQHRQIRCTFESLRYLNTKIWQFFVDDDTGAYPGVPIGGFLAVAREARAKNLATTPTFRPRPLINDRVFIEASNRLLDSRRF